MEKFESHHQGAKAQKRELTKWKYQNDNSATKAKSSFTLEVTIFIELFP